MALNVGGGMHLLTKSTVLFLVCFSIVVTCRGNIAPKTLTACVGAREDLVKAMRSQLEVKSFRGKMVYSTSDGTKIGSSLEFVAPDRYHLITESNVFINLGTVRQELIALGSEAYSRAGAEGQWLRWQRIPGDMSQELPKLRGSLAVVKLVEQADVKFIGEEMLDGSRMRVYQFAFDKYLDSEFKGITKTWVGAADGLPYRIEAGGEAPYQGKTVKAHWVSSYSDYNEDIRIRAPM
jgi:hypothetical protein